jgi:ABC-type branched-subunit amino acid transport system substrate-binding protein
MVATLRILLVLLFACFTAAQAAPPPIVIGQVADLSGRNQDQGRDYVAGATVYFDQVNASGGIRGRRIVHIVRDDAGRADRSVQLASQLLRDDHAELLFGFTGDAAVAALARSQLLQRERALLFAPLSGAEPPAGGGPIVFTQASYATEVKEIVRHFRGQGLTRFAALYVDNGYGRKVMETLQRELASAGIAPVAQRLLHPDGGDAALHARALSPLSPQVLVVIADSLPMAAFLREFKPFTGGTQVVGLSAVNHSTLLELIGPNVVNGTLLTQTVPHPMRAVTPLLREHLAALKRFRDEPPSHLTLAGFIAAKTLVQALRKLPADATRAEIARRLPQLGVIDLDGMEADLSSASGRAIGFADLTLVRRNGELLQ